VGAVDLKDLVVFVEGSVIVGLTEIVGRKVLVEESDPRVSTGQLEYAVLAGLPDSRDGAGLKDRREVVVRSEIVGSTPRKAL